MLEHFPFLNRQGALEEVTLEAFDWATREIFNKLRSRVFVGLNHEFVTQRLTELVSFVKYKISPRCVLRNL